MKKVVVMIKEGMIERILMTQEAIKTSVNVDVVISDTKGNSEDFNSLVKEYKDDGFHEITLFGFKRLQEGPVITEEEFRNKVIDDFAERLSKICEGSGMSINRDNGRPLYAENGVWYDLISETAKQLKNKPDCFISNEEPYPLCKGNGDEKCHNCCIYEDYEKYHSPYNN